MVNKSALLPITGAAFNLSNHAFSELVGWQSFPPKRGRPFVFEMHNGSV